MAPTLTYKATEALALVIFALAVAGPSTFAIVIAILAVAPDGANVHRSWALMGRRRDVSWDAVRVVLTTRNQVAVGHVLQVLKTVAEVHHVGPERILDYVRRVPED